MATSSDIDLHSPSDSCNPDIEASLNSLRMSLGDVSDSLKSGLEDKLNEINNWVREQKRKQRMRNSEGKPKQIAIENFGKVIEATINGTEKFKSGRELDITTGVLDIISSLAVFSGEPHGSAVKALCGVVGAILIHKKPKQPNVVDQLAKGVHEELVSFNKKLQDQKYEGLKRRVSDQTTQLRTMRRGDKLDDPNLWNDYVQFLGELSNRFETPLSFKYNKASLTNDPNVADFVRAVVTYCQAYCCFMALLTAAKGKFAHLGTEYKEDEDAVDRKIGCQREDAKDKLAFLSDERYLTFLGRLPYEGGKLTKIVVLSRNMSGKGLVEAVRGSLSMPKMPDLETVESAATKVSNQSVELKLESHQVPPGSRLRRMVTLTFGQFNWVQFVNETNFPMKVVSGRVGRVHGSLAFVQDLEAHSSYSHAPYLIHPYLTYRISPANLAIFSNGGYLIVYLNGILSAEIDPPARDARVIEFALSEMGPLVQRKISIQDVTRSEFTRGQDTYNAMKSGEAKTLYWSESGVHFMARAEIVRSSFGVTIWRFVVQSFDPLAVQQ